MASSNTLSSKEQALVGIGAAIAAGCQPCTHRLIQAARAAGACERGIRLAIETGLAERARAAEAMALWAEAEQGQVPELDTAFRLEKKKLAALIGIGATFAANSTATLDSQLAKAQVQDWTNVQIAEAFAVARVVARTAAEKIEAAVTRLGFSRAELAVSCCGSESTRDAAETPTQGGCGCAKGAESE